MENVMPFIIASVFLLIFITMSVQMQISTINGMNEVSVDTTERIGYKAAGGLHLMDQGDHFGVISRQEYRQLKQDRSTGCGADISGFREDEFLRFNDEKGCGEVVRPLLIPMTVSNSGKHSVYNITVGETRERVS